MKNTKGVLEYVAETFRKGDVLFSLMRQYTPHGRAEEFPEINRRITDEEYEEAEAYMETLGIEDGYVQQKESSDQSFIPAFDGTGVERAAASNTKNKAPMKNVRGMPRVSFDMLFTSAISS